MQPPLPFQNFLDTLRRHKIPLGVMDYCEVGELLSQWQGTERSRLRDALAALLGTSREEVRTIRTVFDEHFPPYVGAPVEPIIPPPPAIVTGGRYRRVVIAMLAILMLLGGLNRQRIRALIFKPPPPPAAQKNDRPVERSGPTPMTKAEQEPLPRFFAPTSDLPEALARAMVRDLMSARGAELPSRREPLLLAGLFLLTLLVVSLAGRRRRIARQARAKTEQAIRQLPQPFQYAPRIGHLSPLLTRDEIDDFATLLARHCTEYQRGRTIDEKQTVQRYAARGRLERPILKQELLRQPIVLCIDTSLLSRLFRRPIDEVLDGLTRRGIPLNVYYFEREPSRLSMTRYGRSESLSQVLRQHADLPWLFIGVGGRFETDDDELPAWLKLLGRRSRVAWLHPVPDPDLWPELFRSGRLPMPVFGLTATGMHAAALTLARDRGLRPQVHQAAQEATDQVTATDLQRLMQLVALVPQPDLELLEWLRQSFCPEVPYHACVHLFALSEDPTSHKLQLPERLLRQVLQELRRDNPEREKVVRGELLKLYRASEPQLGTAAHLRWQLDCSLQSINLIGLGVAVDPGADGRKPLDVLTGLRSTPLWETVDEEVSQLFSADAPWSLPAVLPPTERRALSRFLQPSQGMDYLLAQAAKGDARLGLTLRWQHALLAVCTALAATVLAYTTHVFGPARPTLTQAYELLWEADFQTTDPSQGRLRLIAKPAATRAKEVDVIDFTDDSKEGRRVASLPFVDGFPQPGPDGFALPWKAQAQAQRLYARSRKPNGDWVYSGGIVVPARAALAGSLRVTLIDDRTGAKLGALPLQLQQRTGPLAAFAESVTPLLAGHVELTVDAKGYQPQTRKLAIAPGQNRELTLRLLAPDGSFEIAAGPRYGIVLVTVRPAGANIDWGKLTPPESTSTRSSDEYRSIAVPGIYPIRVSASGYPNKVETLQVLPGQTTRVTVDLHPDADRDGIADQDDKCPYEPGPAELNGCPRPAKSKAKSKAKAGQQSDAKGGQKVDAKRGQKADAKR